MFIFTGTQDVDGLVDAEVGEQHILQWVRSKVMASLPSPLHLPSRSRETWLKADTEHFGSKAKYHGLPWRQQPTTSKDADFDQLMGIQACNTPDVIACLP